jgi:hypothetical protein
MKKRQKDIGNGRRKTNRSKRQKRETGNDTCISKPPKFIRNIRNKGENQRY